MNTKSLLAALFVLALAPAMAQKVVINKIDESRSTSDGSFSNRCEFELKISGDEVRKYKFARISKLDKIADDQGLDLLKEDYNTRYEKIDEDAKVKIESRKPSRKAEVIKELSGELILFNPTTANGAVIKIANYQKKTNINLLPPTSPVQLMYLTKESVDKYQKEQRAKKEEELKKMPEAARKMAEGLLEIFESFSNYGDDPNQVMFFISGDDSKLVDVYFEDPAGKRISWVGRSQSTGMLAYSFEEKPDPAFTMVINIETPSSIKKLPFKLTEIDLP